MNRFWLVFFICAAPLLVGSFFVREGEILPELYAGKNVSGILYSMPKRDRENLEYFFRELIREDYFGYVLLGEKPMAFSTLTNSVNPFLLLWDKDVNGCDKPNLLWRCLWHLRVAFSAQRIKFKRAYETWRHYESLFPMPEFTLLYEKHTYEAGDCLSIILINNRAFSQAVQEYATDFQTILTPETTGEKMLRESRQKPLLAEVLQSHDGLIGTLLGYGRNNAFWFHQEHKINSAREKSDFCERFHLPFREFDELGFCWTDENLEESRRQRDSLEWTGPLEWVQLPTFRAHFSSEETEALRKRYLVARQTLIAHYRGKDFLQETLELLTAAHGQLPSFSDQMRLSLKGRLR